MINLLGRYACVSHMIQYISVDSLYKHYLFDFVFQSKSSTQACRQGSLCAHRSLKYIRAGLVDIC